MDNTESENSRYHPGGIPLTPQARRFGYQFPVFISESGWTKLCVWTGQPHRQTGTDHRIGEVLKACYRGMMKRLAVSDDFISYEFKIWHWDRDGPKKTKMSISYMGARLFLDEHDDPWLYIFLNTGDSLDDLKKCDLLADGNELGSSEDSGLPPVLYAESGDGADDRVIEYGDQSASAGPSTRPGGSGVHDGDSHVSEPPDTGKRG